MANYPDWVMKYKEKGTYINYTNGKYYLYAAHSKRVPGTDKVKRICDRYIGRITEKDGLIPTRDKVTGNVEIFEYGRSSVMLLLCKNIYSGFKRTFKHNADFIMIAAVLSAIYGYYDNSLFGQSFLSIRFPGLDLAKNTTLKQQTAIERGILMINDTLSDFFKEQSAYAMLHFGTVYKARINGRFYLSKESVTVEALKQNYHIEWED
jgi:hypothetical protein